MENSNRASLIEDDHDILFLTTAEGELMGPFFTQTELDAYIKTHEEHHLDTPLLVESTC